LVKQASEIRFQTREVHEWLASSLRFSQAEISRGDGLDVRTLDLPPGGGLFLRLIANWRRMSIFNRFRAYQLLAEIDSRPIQKAPGIVVIIARRDKADCIDAGRIMVRTWSELNGREIAVHPYYVVSDQLTRLEERSIPAGLEPRAEDIRRELKRLLALSDDETLHMLLRIGYPTREPVRSRRLPIDAVFTDLTEH
jgi:hypothetical protein